jgi:hypothetical protein
MRGKHSNRNGSLLPLTGKWRGYAFAGVGYLLIILAILGEWGEGGSFCADCGLRRTQTGLRVAGVFPLVWFRYRDSQYHRLYRRFVSRDCAHQWHLTSWGWISLHGTGVACGSGAPLAFRDHWSGDPDREVTGGQLAVLERVSDPQTVRTVLLGLANETAVRKHGHAVANAIRELRHVDSRAEENAWWKRRRALFEALRSP